MSTLQNDTDPASRPVGNDYRETKESSDEEHSGATEPPPPLTRNTTAGAGDARAQGEHATVLSGTDVQASEAAVPGRSVDQVDADVEAPAATSPSPLACLDSTSRDLDAFQQSVEAWAQSALRFLETTTHEHERIAVRDEAVRVAALAAAVDAGVAVAIANEVLQRAVRSLGKNSPRRRAGRPRSAASDEAAPDSVGGDTTAAPEGNESGQRPPHVGENGSPGGTISVDGPRSTTGDLPRATRSAYRKDAESLTDTGFERISASVRAAAAADPAAGHRLGRGLVRAAGAVEAAGGDPGDLQVVEAKKQEMSDARKRSASTRPQTSHRVTSRPASSRSSDRSSATRSIWTRHLPRRRTVTRAPASSTTGPTPRGPASRPYGRRTPELGYTCRGAPMRPPSSNAF